jgi:mRNA-degrading endonuclease RelE of RelBE toxin-antitoxin system
MVERIAKWAVIWTATAERDFGKLDPDTRRRVQLSINRYATDSLGDVLRLQGITPPEYRLRVGKWRVRFRLDHGHGTMQILHVFLRDEAY